MTETRTIPALVASAAERFAAHPAFVTDDVELTWSELRDQVRTASGALLASGVRPGDRVGVWAPNLVEFMVALLGAESIGAAVVPINTRYRGEEARVILSRARASALFLVNGFLGADYSAMLREAGQRAVDAGDLPAIAEGETSHDLVPGLPHLHTVVDLNDASGGPDTGWTDFLARAAQVPLEQVEAAEAAVTPDTVCDILFTSGTTGVPKGVMSTHAMTTGVAHVWARGANLTEADRYAIVNPFFHSFGYKAGVLAAMTAGTTVHPVATFDAASLMQLIQDAGITVLPGAPTLFISLINHPDRERYDLSSLRFSIAGAASVPETLYEEMQQVLGFREVAQAYGLTECVVATQSRPNEDPRHIAETTGPAVAGLEIKIVDGEGNEAPTGTDGEIWIRGHLVMKGYFEDPAATAEAIDPDGWFHSGDVGRMDEHGCVKITDRIKDMFTVGGFNVYPAEVENTVSAHPDVIESAVIGVPDERMGEVGRAYVRLRDGAELDTDALTAWCRERLANFKVPREFVALAEFPRNASGKVLKTDLRA